MLRDMTSRLRRGLMCLLTIWKVRLGVVSRVVLDSFGV